MAKIEEVEAALREALDTVVQHGVVLIYGEYGVVWNEIQSAWVWDREMFLQIPHCDCVGAFLATVQPKINILVHKGDLYEAACGAFNADRIWLRDLMNGFDNLDYQKSGYPNAHAMGVRLRKDYRPLCFECMALTGNGVKISSLYEDYLREFCLPPEGILTLVHPPSVAEPDVALDAERPSGTYLSSRVADQNLPLPSIQQALAIAGGLELSG
jgi:hypothetical protein